MAYLRNEIPLDDLEGPIPFLDHDYLLVAFHVLLPFHPFQALTVAGS